MIFKLISSNLEKNMSGLKKRKTIFKKILNKCSIKIPYENIHMLKS